MLSFLAATSASCMFASTHILLFSYNVSAFFIFYFLSLHDLLEILGVPPSFY